MSNEDTPLLDGHLKYLKLPFMREHYQSAADRAARKNGPTSATLKTWQRARPPCAATTPSGAASARPASR
jgi:hypothetical protein